MAKTKSNVDSLLAAIKRTTPAPEAVQPIPEPPASSPPPLRKSAKATRSNTTTKAKATGRNFNIFLHEEDRKLIRELAAWLAGQGIRTSDSGVIKAALRTAKIGGELLQAYRQASLLDARVTRNSDNKVA